MPERTYSGPLHRGSTTVAGERVTFTRGEPVDVSAAAAAVLDRHPDWSRPEPKKAAGKKKPDPSPDPTEGSEPDHKEP